MQLSEYKRNIKDDSFLKVLSLIFQSLTNKDLAKKERQENYNQKRYNNRNLQLVNDNLSDYKYNRGYYR